jgi:hypothetical protein
MKKLYLILLVLVVNSVICFGSEQIELSSRLGKTISLDSRNYFGLFPDVKDYKSAVLIKDNGINYIEISAENSKEKSKIILSDSAVTTLAYVIDNYEGIISEPAKYKLNGKLVSGLIRINTQFNKKVAPVKIKLRDSTEFSGFILYADSSAIVTTQDSAFRPANRNFKITGYSDIYSISNVDYPIIDGTEIVFLINLKSIQKITLFKNANAIKVAPPEVFKYIAENSIPEVKESYKSLLDFDKLYFKRMSISFDYSYEQFYPNKLQLLSVLTMTNVPMKLTLDKYHTFGVNFDCKLTRFLQIQLSYNLEKIDFYINRDYPTKSFLGNGFGSDLYLKVWTSKKSGFEPQRFFAYLYGGFQLSFYQPYVTNTFSTHCYAISGLEIVSGMKKSYHTGINFKYIINNSSFISLSGFMNYHNDLGIIYYGTYDYDSYITRYIDYIITYGFKIGFGSEF